MSKLWGFNSLPWFLSVLLLVLLVLSNIRQPQKSHSHLLWRDSEFDTVKKEVPLTLRTRRFQAGLVFNETHQVYIPPTYPAYVGRPSPQIDAEWEKITSPANVFITEKEKLLFPNHKLYLDVETGLYTGSVAMTHDLHCLNMLRKARYPAYYPELKAPSLEAHLDHCLDSLRESIMCSADMTIIPVVWSVNRNWIRSEFRTDHTCRDFYALRTWALSRDSADSRRYVAAAERFRTTGSFLEKRSTP